MTDPKSKIKIGWDAEIKEQDLLKRDPWVLYVVGAVVALLVACFLIILFVKFLAGLSIFWLLAFVFLVGLVVAGALTGIYAFWLHILSIKTSKKRTMDNEHGDDSDHLVCNECGYCIDCGDCRGYGCGLEDCGEPDKEDSVS